MLIGTIVYAFVNSIILALMAIGFNLTFGISGVANFAYGALYIFSAYATWMGLNLVGMPYPVAAAVSILLTMLAGLLAWAALPAYAQQPISGNYAPGAFTGMKGVYTPPPGKFLLENGTLFYNTRDFVDSNGDARQTDTVNVVANRTIFGYVTPLKILGGDYFPAVIFPLANVALRPEPGSQKDFQLGDLIRFG